MKAKRRGRLVHTIRGQGARLPESKPVTADSTATAPVDVTGTEISVLIPRAAPIPKPERVCPHGGIYLGGMALCGECEQRDANELFGLAVLYTARKAARKIQVVTSTVDDCVMTAVMALVYPKNKTKILKANNPDAMAYTIAERAIKRLYRSGSVKSMSVGKMSFENIENDDLAETTSQKLEYLDGMVQVQQEKQHWADACYERARVFPGIGLLWTEKNLNRLQIVLDEAKRLLPTKTFSHWIVINMRLGLSEGMQEHTWEEIAEQVTTFKEITERMVRYAYNEGLKSIKAHLINSLMPDKKLTNEESAG